MTPAADHFCVFEFATEFFAVSAKQIREIRSKPNFALVPGVAHVLAGLWHEGSEFVPVLRLPISHSATTPSESQMAVIHGASGRWALLVDQVHNIEEIECSQGGVGIDNAETFVMGMSTWKGHSVRVLSLDAIYRSAEASLRQDWANHFANLA